MGALKTFHFGYSSEHLVVFRETFQGDGADLTFQLTGNVGNATFAQGEWEVAQVKNTYVADVSNTTRATLYDGVNPLTRHKISVSSISASGLVTLDYPPQNGAYFYVWYWYNTASDVLSDYYRDDFVNSMEADAGVAIASGITVDTAAFAGLLDSADDTVQKALDSLDDLAITSDYGVTGTVTAGSIKINTSQDLQAAASPTFVTAKLTGLTDGYVPYHVSDAAGLANSPILISASEVYTYGSLWGFGLDDDTYLKREAANTIALYAAGNKGFSMYGAGGLCSFALGVGASHSDDLFNFYYAPTNDTGAHGLYVTYLPTITISAAYDNFGLVLDLSGTKVASGITGSGSILGLFINATMNNANFLGTLTNNRGAFIYHGLGGSAGAGSTLTVSSGLYVRGYEAKGTLGNSYDVYIESPVTGGTLSGSHWGLYQVSATQPNYLGGLLGIRTNAPEAPLEVEDGATAKSMVVKITQDDTNVYGLVIGNDTYSTTDTDGLRLQVDNSGNALVTWTAGNFTIGPSTDTDAIKYSGSDSWWEFTTHLRTSGNGIVYRDINMGAAAVHAPSSGYPSMDELKDEAGADTGVETYSFAIGESLSGQFEMDHDYQEGGDIVFHVHWQGITAPGGGTDNVKFQLDYTIARDDNTINAMATIYSERAFTTRYAQVRSDFTTITGSTGGVDGGNIKIGDQFCFVLKRIAASSDDYAGDALFVTAGLHIPVNSLGSRTISAK